MSTNPDKITTKKTEKSPSPYGEAFSSNAAENYERYFVPAIGAPLAKELVDWADLHQGERVLDVACGTGIIARLASQKIGTAEPVTGLDINPGMLSVARSITPSAEWHHGSAEKIPIKDKIFDVAFCQLSLQFMEDKQAVIQEIYRVLKDGGRLIINVPGPAGPLFQIFANALEQHINKETAGFVTQVFSLHDTSEIQQLLKKAGFQSIDIEAEEKLLHLPAPKDFLWQYIHSTPMIEMVSKTEKKAQENLEKEIIEQWQQFKVKDGMHYRQRVISAKAHK